MACHVSVHAFNLAVKYFQLYCKRICSLSITTYLTPPFQLLGLRQSMLGLSILMLYKFLAYLKTLALHLQEV